MARNLIQSCFPDTARLLRAASPTVFDYLLPESCTPLALGSVAYATLLPLCVFGVAASLHGFLTVKHSIYRRALLYYVCMNAVAAMRYAAAAADSQPVHQLYVAFIPAACSEVRCSSTCSV